VSDALPVETASADEIGFKRQRQWPLLGPALWIFGAVLWAYVVAGELSVRTDSALVEALGAVAVLATLGANGYAAMQCGPHGRKWELRILPGVIAVALWVLVLGVLTRVSGAPTRSEVEGITVALWIVSFVAFLLGRYLTGPSRRSLAPRGRFGRIVLWTISALVTLIALGSATSQF
jgi:hypothetical protein